MQDQYFATLPPDEIGAEIFRKIDEHYVRHDSSGMFSRQRASWRAYFGMSSNSSLARADSIQHGGQDGELSFIKVNHLRNLGQHLLNLTTSQKPAPIPISTNTDSKSHGQTILASGLLDYYSREKRVDRILRDAAEYSIISGEGYVLTEWDPSLGREFEVDEENVRVIREGDLKFTRLTKLDVVRDVRLDRFEDASWVIVRTWANKYELIANYPAYADEILKIKSDTKREMRWELGGLNQNSDQIPVWKFFHKRSGALVGGRHVILCSPSCVLFDGDLPYKNVPLRRIVPAEITGSCDGYTPIFDLLALQEAVDALHSACTTNLTSFGVANLWVPNGSNFGYDEIAKNMNLFSGTQKPEVIDLAPPPDKLIAYIRELVESMETISGVNSTVRGNPEASLKSGSALALVQSQAIQFSSGLQSNYAALVEDVYTDSIDILKDYAKTKRVALIVGKFNQYMMKEFTGADVADISRVVVEVAGPVAKTAAGRMQIAQDLLANQMIKTPEEYMSVINTGKLEPMTESQTRQLQLIRKENERLAQGIACRAAITDDHALHILENKVVADDPELRSAYDAGDERAIAIMDAVFAHINEHIMMGADPALVPMMMALKHQPIMPPMPVEQAAGGTPPGGGVNAMAPTGPTPDGMPNQPEMPTNPATGNAWDPQTGGIGPPV
jgi:hypothetical protein